MLAELEGRRKEACCCGRGELLLLLWGIGELACCADVRRDWAVCVCRMGVGGADDMGLCDCDHEVVAFVGARSDVLVLMRGGYLSSELSALSLFVSISITQGRYVSSFRPTSSLYGRQVLAVPGGGPAGPEVDQARPVASKFGRTQRYFVICTEQKTPQFPSTRHLFPAQ